MTAWVDSDTHGWVSHPADDADWEALLKEYGGDYPGPLEQVLRVVRDGGCQTVVIENRYVDLDYRSEYSAFWSLQFESPPAFARRAHFFSGKLDPKELHRIPDDAGYLGYSV